ncbi:MAG: pyruvate kinase [Gammaproteobacteria bacterium]|nr:pyruvate kinase [Gammaproteobacteria bacterium]
MNIDNKRTKIVCTLGPASQKQDVLCKMIDAGMNTARVNFSHGDDKTHGEAIDLVRKCSKITGRYVGVLMDLKGPKIRLGVFEKGKVHVKPGDRLTAYSKELVGNDKEFYIRQPELFNDVHSGDTLLVDDGKVILKVLSSNSEKMEVEVINEGDLSDNKGINAPGVILTMPFVSEKDYNDLMFGIERGVDSVACSFVRRADDVKQIRRILNENGGRNIEIIAKIENQEGVDNVADILQVANGVMVARGDMGVELPFELVPVYQKKIIQLANQIGKPVITATHMLESMIHCPRPTRAEASDVSNAVLDGTDAVMLSGESAVGDYPVESVDSMARIIKEIEKTIDYERKFESLVNHNHRDINDAIGVSVASCCLSIDKARAVFAFTDTGGTAKRISHYRPSEPIIALTSNPITCNKLSYYWGVYPVLVKNILDFKEFDIIAREVAESLGLKRGDIVVQTTGFGVEHGQTNTIRLLEL